MQLAAKDPGGEEMRFFRAQTAVGYAGGDGAPLPVVGRSADWYAGHVDALAPALIRRAVREAV
ncbi:MAG: hypothetical protein IPI02_11155 [Sterolibacteriaceae bacterium]|nr:hypothetical protein [Sterolibacteriaceae bacterium]